MLNSNFWLYWRTMFAFENWHSALEMKRYVTRFVHHLGGLPDFSALRFTRYNQYESIDPAHAEVPGGPRGGLPLQHPRAERLLQLRRLPRQRPQGGHPGNLYRVENSPEAVDAATGVQDPAAAAPAASAPDQTIELTEDDLVFITPGSCVAHSSFGMPGYAGEVRPDAHRGRRLGFVEEDLAAQCDEFGHPETFCSTPELSNWESATITTLDERILPYIRKICHRDPLSGNVVTGGIVSVKDSNWLLSWTINRQPQFRDQKPGTVCVWVYSLFTDTEGNYVKKPMRDCTGKEICEEWLYHLGVPEDQIEELAENSANTVPCMMPYITAFFMPRAATDRPKVVPQGAVNFAFVGQFAETPRDTIFTTEYSMRTGMEAVYTLLDIDRGVPEVWGSCFESCACC